MISRIVRMRAGYVARRANGNVNLWPWELDVEGRACARSRTFRSSSLRIELKTNPRSLSFGGKSRLRLVRLLDGLVLWRA